MGNGQYFLIFKRKELGRGHYGVVFRAHVVDGAARWPVALKCAKAPETTEGEGYNDGAGGALLSPQEELVKEGEVMATLPYHENIANLQVGPVNISAAAPATLTLRNNHYSSMYSGSNNPNKG